MAIRLTYSCRCGYRTNLLEAAEQHAQQTSHTVDITGTLTPKISIRQEAIEAAAKQKALDNEILRRARDRGLLRK